MRLRKPCEHNLYDEHPWGGYSVNDLCPGGEFLPEDALVIEKVEGEWPDSALNKVLMTFSRVAMKGHVEHPTDLLAALADQVGEPG